MPQIAIADLKKICIESLLRLGASADEAAVIFADHLYAEATGRTTHGFGFWHFPVQEYKYRNPAPTVVVQGAGRLVVDAQRNNGHTAVRFAINQALASMEPNGICLIAVRNMQRFNTAALITREVAEKGYIIRLESRGGVPFVSPPAGAAPILGTNPLNIAFPHTDPIFIADFAISQKAMGYFKDAARDGRKVKPGWGYTADGALTDDPNEIKILVPFGDESSQHKSFALGMIHEVLAGGLIGVPMGSQTKFDKMGAMITLIHPTAFGQTVDEYKTAITTLLREITAAKPLTDKPVRYSGQQAEARWQAVQQSGSIDLPDTVWTHVQNTCAQATRAA